MSGQPNNHIDYLQIVYEKRYVKCTAPSADEFIAQVEAERDAAVVKLAEVERWETGFRNIVTQLIGARTEFEIPQVVEMVSDLKQKLAEAEKDTARLDWLETIGFSTARDGASREEKPAGVHCWRRSESVWGWTAHWISSEFRSARAAIDAVINKTPPLEAMKANLQAMTQEERQQYVSDYNAYKALAKERP